MICPGLAGAGAASLASGSRAAAVTGFRAGVLRAISIASGVDDFTNCPGFALTIVFLLPSDFIVFFDFIFILIINVSPDSPL
jgi:hypothetical protein